MLSEGVKLSRILLLSVGGGGTVGEIVVKLL